MEAVQSFANLYFDEEFSKNIEVYFSGFRQYVVVLPKADEMQFMFAVNYLSYPESKVKFDDVIGFDGITRRTYFIPSSDDEYDNCYTIDSENRCLKHCFDGNASIAECGQQYIDPGVDLSALHHICTISAVKVKKRGFLSWLFG
ncbi:hypothetical protein QP938_07295 [Porticoccaceae bacterium LTM1]|nr:hypothetical protein QP938_07295 [Porticoccaceae bacterium LTM1]